MGLKLVSFYPGNAGTSVPTHSAVILLFDPRDGVPLAVLDDDDVLLADDDFAHFGARAGEDFLDCLHEWGRGSAVGISDG